MKIAYIANVRMPTEKAHGYQIAKMCEMFALHCETELFAPTRRDEVKSSLFDYYGLKNNFEVNKIYIPDFISVTPLFLRKLGFFLQSVFFLFRLAFLKIEKDTIVYSRNPEIIWLFSKRGYKTIFESHRWPDTKIGLHKFFIKKSFKIIAVTSFLKKLYVKSGFFESDVLVSPDGVDLTVFDIDTKKEEARKILNLPLNSILLGYTGRTQTMGMEKGFFEILRALQKILKEGRDVFFVSVGEKIPEKNNHFVAVDRVDRKTLALYQKAFDVLLMPFPKTTHYSYYMSPMKMFEYMAGKRPIVASDLPSVREVLNENNAVLVESGNPKSLADGIKKVLENSEFAQSIANQAYEDVKEYTWEKRAERILTYLKI